MAWIVLDLDETLLQDGGADPMTGQPVGDVPVDGALEACTMLANEGHRLTIYTSRFAPMPDSEKQRLKDQIEGDLQSYGFPPMEVWTGSTKPDADLFIGSNHITFDNDWNLVLAQMQVMMRERGIEQPQPMGDPNGMGQPGDEQQQLPDGYEL